MSFLICGELQAAVWRRLSDDPVIAGLVEAAIYDAPPDGAPNALPADYVTLGEETARPNNTKTSQGAVHDFEVVVHSRREGFDSAKRIAGAICAALIDAPLSVEGGVLVDLRFLRAKATRGPAPEKRQVALRFRAILDQN